MYNSTKLHFYLPSVPGRLSLLQSQRESWRVLSSNTLWSLACWVLDFTLFAFYPTSNVLSKRQFRNLSANTAINDVYQSNSGPLPTYFIITIPTLYCHCYLPVSTHCIALQRLAVRCITLLLGKRRHYLFNIHSFLSPYPLLLPQYLFTLTNLHLFTHVLHIRSSHGSSFDFHLFT